uniref:Uncharacterized protein n=1 Tax=Rhodopseudomonas palustris (strain BisA53) TaxID=316055 RepID=Q07RA1_RHOP5
MADPRVPVVLRAQRTRLFCAVLAGLFAATGVSWSSAARAQMPNVNLIPELESKTPEQIEQDKITQKAYRDSLRKIPDSKAASDPWGDVRSAAPPKTTSAKPKARTGNAAQ